MKKLSFLAATLFLAGTAQAQIQPFTWVDGDLRDLSQNPVLDTAVTIKAIIKINTCQVYAETHVKDLSTTNGHYAIKLGQGTPVETVNSFSTAIDPTKGANCYPSGTSGNGIRTLTVQATLSNADVITVPAFELGFAPSTTGVPEYLQTNSVAAPYHKFLNTAGTYGVQVIAPSSLSANYMLTLPMDSGSNGQVLTTDGTGVLSWSTPGGGSPVTGLTQGAGILITNSSGNYTIASTNNGTVTSVSSSNSDISVATSTTTPVLTLNTGTGANQILKLDGSGALPAVSGAYLTGLNASNLTTGSIPVARMPAFNGDVTSSAGSTTLSLTTVPVNKGGTGSTSFAANKVVITNGTGSALTGTSCSLNEVISFDAGGIVSCNSVAGLLMAEPPSSLRAESGSGVSYTPSGTPTFGTTITVKNTASITNASAALALEIANGSSTQQKAWISAISNGSGYSPTIAFGSTDSASTYKELMRISPQGPIFGPLVTLDRASGSAATIQVTTNGVGRWKVGVTSNAETGSNVGSDFIISRLSDGGTILDNPLYINRANGNVGIGTAAPSQKFEVAGTALATLWNTTSDRRYKKDIRPLDSSLEKITQLRGVSYDWRRDEFPEKNFSDRRQIGFIAQEIEPVFPEMVETGSNGYKSVNYQAFVAPLVDAVKDLYTLFLDQSREIEELKSKNQELENRLQKIENALSAK